MPSAQFFRHQRTAELQTDGVAPHATVAAMADVRKTHQLEFVEVNKYYRTGRKRFVRADARAALVQIIDLNLQRRCGTIERRRTSDFRSGEDAAVDGGYRFGGRITLRLCPPGNKFQNGAHSECQRVLTGGCSFHRFP